MTSMFTAKKYDLHDTIIKLSVPKRNYDFLITYSWYEFGQACPLRMFLNVSNF